MGDPVIHGFQEAFHIDLVASGLDRKGLQADTTAILWGSETMKQLAQIRMVNTGLMLLHEIQGAGPRVRISPRFPYVGFDRDCNSDTLGSEHFDPAEAIAAGTGAVVHFSPQHFRTGGFCDRHDDSHAATLPHEILFHELVHAMRYVTKKNKKTPLHGGLLRYDNNEEFYAVLVTNIFISDPSNALKSALREGHTAPRVALAKGLDGSYEFFRSGAQVYDLIAKFFADHPVFAHKLACSNATFNPLAAYDRSPAKARQMSQSGFAKARAAVGDVLETVESQAWQSQYVNPLLKVIGLDPL